jgi:hypothetical protein
MGKELEAVAALQPSFGLISFNSRHERDRSPLSLLREELSSFHKALKRLLIFKMYLLHRLQTCGMVVDKYTRNDARLLKAAERTSSVGWRPSVARITSEGNWKKGKSYIRYREQPCVYA